MANEKILTDSVPLQQGARRPLRDPNVGILGSNEASKGGMIYG